MALRRAENKSDWKVGLALPSMRDYFSVAEADMGFGSDTKRQYSVAESATRKRIILGVRF